MVLPCQLLFPDGGPAPFASIHRSLQKQKCCQHVQQAALQSHWLQPGCLGTQGPGPHGEWDATPDTHAGDVLHLQVTEGGHVAVRLHVTVETAVRSETHIGLGGWGAVVQMQYLLHPGPRNSCHCQGWHTTPGRVTWMRSICGASSRRRASGMCPWTWCWAMVLTSPTASTPSTCSLTSEASLKRPQRGSTTCIKGWSMGSWRCLLPMSVTPDVMNAGKMAVAVGCGNKGKGCA